MQLILGLLIWAVFFACVYVAYLIGRKSKQVHVVKQQEAPDEEMKRRAKEIQDHFQSLMNYDVNQAVQRKKVT